jgi:tripeptidyl-peptidase-2
MWANLVLEVQEIVNQHGAVFVASAGNSGPGLSTVGAPGGTSECIISVGAFVSPGLAEVGHAVRLSALPEGWQGQHYNWSSRGECLGPFLCISIRSALIGHDAYVGEI